jgi:hypothetical protein
MRPAESNIPVGGIIGVPVRESALSLLSIVHSFFRHRGNRVDKNLPTDAELVAQQV